MHASACTHIDTHRRARARTEREREREREGEREGETERERGGRERGKRKRKWQKCTPAVNTKPHQGIRLPAAAVSVHHSIPTDPSGYLKMPLTQMSGTVKPLMIFLFRSKEHEDGSTAFFRLFVSSAESAFF